MKKNEYAIGERVQVEVVVKRIAVDKTGTLEYSVGSKLDDEGLFDTIRLGEGKIISSLDRK